MGAEGARVEELNVIIVGEAGHGGHGVASGVEVGGGNKCGNNTSATSGEDAEERFQKLLVLVCGHPAAQTLRSI